jgi:G3E family GTPase
VTAFPVPVTVLTGFLGAGKTSLVNRLLSRPGMDGTAVIVNEFGEVSIDHLLVEQASDGVIQLADGCLCCTVRGDLVDTLADLLDRAQTGRIAALERILIETSGLADPVPVLQALMGHPVLAQALRLDGVVTMVDALNGLVTLEEHVESVRQVAVADRLIFTKTDLARPEGRLRDALRRLNPSAPMVEAKGAEDPAALLLGGGLYDPATKTADVRRWLGDAARHGHDHHDHKHEHEHDHAHDHHHHHAHDDSDRHRHGDRVSSFSLVHDSPVPFSTIEMFLDLLRSSHGERLLRMKGIVELAEDPERPLVIHGVRNMMHPPARLAGWPDGQRGTRLVLIGQHLDEDHVRRLFDAFTGRPRLDAPDRAALTDNPLAIPGLPSSR